MGSLTPYSCCSLSYQVSQSTVITEITFIWQFSELPYWLGPWNGCCKIDLDSLRVEIVKSTGNHFALKASVSFVGKHRQGEFPLQGATLSAQEKINNRSKSLQEHLGLETHLCFAFMSSALPPWPFFALKAEKLSLTQWTLSMAGVMLIWQNANPIDRLLSTDSVLWSAFTDYSCDYLPFLSEPHSFWLK